MQFALTPEQTQFRDAVRDALKKGCPPAVVRAAWAEDAARPSSAWKTLASIGAIGLLAAERFGGLAMTEIEMALVLEEAGRAGVPDPVTEVAAVAIPLLQDIGTEVATQDLDAVVSGQRLVAVDLGRSPLIVGADAAACCVAVRDGDIYRIDRDALKWIAERSVDRSRRVGRIEWKTNEAVLLVTGERAHEIAESAFNRAALATAAQLIGVASQLLDMAVEYAKVRQQFGKPIGVLQAVKHRLADAALKLEFARPLVYRAAYALAEREDDASVSVSMAKSAASDAAGSISKAALQVHGAIGYTYEYDLHHWMKRAWALAVENGDAAWHRERVAQAVLGPRPTDAQTGRSQSIPILKQGV